MYKSGKQLKKELVELLLFKFGATTLIHVIKEFEEEEKFEECLVIYEVINDANFVFGLQLQTKLSRNSIDIFLSELNVLGLEGETAISNLPFYVAECKEEISKLFLMLEKFNHK